MTEALVEKKPSKVEETPEEKTTKELAAQQKDFEQAKSEVDAQEIVPKEPFYEIRLHEGIGPLAYETPRGLIKVFSGEYILLYRYKTGEKYSDGTDIYAEDFLVVTKAALEALQLGLTLPISLTQRTAEIGRERRGDKPHPDNSLPGPRLNPNPLPLPGVKAKSLEKAPEVKK